MIFVVKNCVSTCPRFVVELYFYLLRVLLGIKLVKGLCFSARAVKCSFTCLLTSGILGGRPSMFRDDLADPIPPMFCTDLYMKSNCFYSSS